MVRNLVLKTCLGVSWLPGVIIYFTHCQNCPLTPTHLPVCPLTQIVGVTGGERRPMALQKCLPGGHSSGADWSVSRPSPAWRQEERCWCGCRVQIQGESAPGWRNGRTLDVLLGLTDSDVSGSNDRCHTLMTQTFISTPSQRMLELCFRARAFKQRLGSSVSNDS